MTLIATGIDTRAVVTHFDAKTSPVGFDLDGDDAAVHGESIGVVEQVLQHLLEASRIDTSRNLSAVAHLPRWVIRVQ